ncbi:Hint domain-containing protein [Amycolatopsis sp. NPDC058340]|uniref:Hint domain-containing protein n=1 Tax=Amycolatopsis sp. NPDC058340 TaxID=3346453 RepID=UPI00365FE778
MSNSFICGAGIPSILVSGFSSGGCPGNDVRRVHEAEERLPKTTCNSFAPGTLVVMADGSRRPIEQLKLDDQVLATDAETGKPTPRKVVATITGHGQNWR